MVDHDYVGLSANDQIVWTNLNLVASQALYLSEQDARVQHYPIANAAGFVRMQDSRWDQVQNEFLIINHQCVASVVASLKSDNVIGRLTQEINDFPLALVSPLGSNHNYIRHGVNLCMF
jgi:hypothetical protein